MPEIPRHEPDSKDRLHDLRKKVPTLEEYAHFRRRAVEIFSAINRNADNSVSPDARIAARNQLRDEFGNRFDILDRMLRDPSNEGAGG